MKATLTHEIILTDFNQSQADRIKSALTFDNPAYQTAIDNGYPVFDLEPIIQLWRYIDRETLAIPRGVTLDWLKPDEIDDQRHKYPVTIDSIIEPRSYQERAIRLALSAGQGVIVAPTGAGKTTMAIELAARLGQRCLILVNKKDLAIQWQTAIKRFTGEDCGLIGDSKFIEGAKFTVALVQTLNKHKTGLDYGLVVCDECHNAPARQSFEVINRQTAAYRFGLSATPQRRDRLEFMMLAAIGNIVAEIEQHEVEGAVLPVTIYTKELPYNGGEVFNWAQFVNELADDDDRNQIIVNSAIKASRSAGTAVLTGTITHAERLYKLIGDYGVKALLLHGQLPKKARAEAMTKAESHNLIIGTLSLLSEGIDWPHIKNIIIATPVSASVDRKTPAATRLIQAIGRGRRPYKNATHCNVLEFEDLHPLGKSAQRKRDAVYRFHGFFAKRM